MAQSSNVKKTPLKVDASASDVLLIASAPFLLYLGVSAKPAAGDACVTIDQPFRVPKGSGAYVAAVGEKTQITASPLGVTTTPAALIEQGFALTGGSQSVAAGANVTFNSSPANADGTVTYQWFWRSNFGEQWVLIDPAINATAATATLVKSAVKGQYKVEGVDAAGSKATARFDLTITA